MIRYLLSKNNRTIILYLQLSRSIKHHEHNRSPGTNDNNPNPDPHRHVSLPQENALRNHLRPDFRLNSKCHQPRITHMLSI